MAQTKGGKGTVARSIGWFRRTIYPVCSEHKWSILLTSGVIVFIFGYFGFWIYSGGKDTPLNLIYESLQLFLLRSGYLSSSSNPLLDFARVAAPIIAFISLIVVVTDSIYRDARLVWLKATGTDHVIVCGLGYIGPIIARHYHKKGESVVVIEKDPTHPEIEKMKELGIFVIVGDATESRILEKVKVESAQALFAVTGSDEVNAKVVLKVDELLSKSPRLMIPCYIHIVDPKFSNLLRATPISIHGKTHVSLEFFNIYLAASQCFIDCMEDILPLETNAPDRHILIAGFGKMGESLLVSLAKRWKERYGQDPDKKLLITVIDKEGQDKVESLKIRYHNISNFCEIKGLKMDFSIDPAFYRASYLDYDQTGRKVDFAFICTSDESINFSVALYLNSKLDGAVPIVIRTVRSKGFAHFFNDICNSTAGEFRNIRVFPLVSCDCCMESLTEGINEVIARAIHAVYVLSSLKKGARMGSDPAMQPWHKLDLEYKESNRDQAANLRVRLQEIGYTLISLTDWSEPPFQFTKEEIESLATAEHDRWMQNRVKRGWTYGEKRDLEKKTSPYLVRWDELDDETKEYDREFVRSYPAILSLVDLKIVPIPVVSSEVDCTPENKPWKCVTKR